MRVLPPGAVGALCFGDEPASTAENVRGASVSTL